jgi:hypothetical protein
MRPIAHLDASEKIKNELGLLMVWFTSRASRAPKTRFANKVRGQYHLAHTLLCPQPRTFSLGKLKLQKEAISLDH